MKKWLLLVGAVLCEVLGSLSLKAALDHPGWYGTVVIGYIGAFAFLAGVLRAGLALGVAYGIWGAAGVALTAVLSAVIFDEPLTVLMSIGIVAVIGGVLMVELGAQSAARDLRTVQRGGESGRS